MGKVKEEFDILFEDLMPETQERLLKFMGLDRPEEGNFDIAPLCVLPKAEGVEKD